MKIRITNPDIGLNVGDEYELMDQEYIFQIEHPQVGPLWINKNDCEIVEEDV